MTETVRRAANNYLQKYSQTPPMSLKEESEVDLKFVNSQIVDDELHLNVAYFVFLTRKYSDSAKKLGEQSYIERATQAGYNPFPAFNFNPQNVENQTTLFLGISSSSSKTTQSTPQSYTMKDGDQDAKILALETSQAEQDLIIDSLQIANSGQDTVLLQHENRLDTLENASDLLNFLGWTTIIPSTPGTAIGDFYYKGIEPIAEGYYRWNGTIWYEVQYSSSVDLTGFVLDNGTTPFQSPQGGVDAVNPNELVTLGQLSVPQAYRDSDSNDIIINPTVNNADIPNTVRTISSLENVRVRFEPVWTIDDGNDYIMKFIIDLDVPDGTRVFLDLLFKPTININNTTSNVSAPIFQVVVQGDTIPIHDYRDSVSSGNYRGLRYHYEMVGFYEVVKVAGKNRLIKL